MSNICIFFIFEHMGPKKSVIDRNTAVLDIQHSGYHTIKICSVSGYMFRYLIYIH